MRKSPILVALTAFALTGGFIYQEKTNAAAAALQAEELKKSLKMAPAQPQEQKLEAVIQESPASAEPAAPEVPLGPQRFYLMPDGSPVPPLPSSAPKKLKLSVVLFAYDGAQMVPQGFRSRSEALVLAKAALASASLDMKQAIAQGDPGSRDDIGWVRRGVLENYVEYRVFNLKKGELLPEVLDTPRGLWVVKRTR